MLNEKWQTLLDVADFAFQPIVNIYTGKLYAVEALIRNYEGAGFVTIDAIFGPKFFDMSSIVYSVSSTTS